MTKKNTSEFFVIHNNTIALHGDWDYTIPKIVLKNFKAALGKMTAQNAVGESTIEAVHQPSLRASGTATSVAIHTQNPSKSVIASVATKGSEARQSPHLDSKTAHQPSLRGADAVRNEAISLSFDDSNKKIASPFASQKTRNDDSKSNHASGVESSNAVIASRAQHGEPRSIHLSNPSESVIASRAQHGVAIHLPNPSESVIARSEQGERRSNLSTAIIVGNPKRDCHGSLRESRNDDSGTIHIASAESPNANPTLTLDFAGVTALDFAMANSLLLWLKNTPCALINLQESHEKMLKLIVATPIEAPKKTAFPFVKKVINHAQNYAKDFANDIINFTNFIGKTLFYLAKTALNPRSLRLESLIFHMNESGFRALPVVLLTCFIVSYAITLQGAIQLSRFGVALFSVEMMAKLSLREIGPFILALVIAGRSASAFAAQIGVGRLNEELDAMKVMDFDAMRFLVLPRVLALAIVMPLLVFLADAASLLANALALNFESSITLSQYLERFYEFVEIRHFVIGLVKAPFFGATIALVGCYRGFCVESNTQSVGKFTTISVVNAMFWIIVINAIFSLLTARFGV